MRFICSLLVLLFSLNICFAQTWEELSSMPEPVANNAVTTAQVNGETYVYSFAGIDATKSCDGDHLRSFRYHVNSDTWEAIPDIPDAVGGKIATGASTVKNKIYVTGGYHLAPNCAETSSPKIHIFNPETNEWEADGANMPIAIDDQVQAVYRDSLIVMVTGWSNTTNVTTVQIYNPEIDEWQVGTAVPNQSEYRVFGASGTIIGDTLYYAGGARIGSSFPPSNTLRKGYINPEDPSEITWSIENNTEARGYRMGASDFQDRAVWFGGSDVTYNFDGIAYNGSGGVAPLDRISFYNPVTGKIDQFTGWMPLLMDLRGVAKISDNQFILTGGMLENQEVSDKTFLLTLDELSSIPNSSNTSRIAVYPNPTASSFSIQQEGEFYLRVNNSSGQRINDLYVRGNENISIINLPSGVYHIQVFSGSTLVGISRLIKL